MPSSIEQPIVYTDEYGNPLSTGQYQPMIVDQTQADNIIKYQLETFDDIARLMRVFKGETYSPDEKKWIGAVKDSEGKIHSMMNDIGITEVVSFVLEGKTVLLSNYDKQTLYKTLRALLNTLTRMIYNNNAVYGIRDTATADAIMDIVFNHLQAMFLAAENGDMRLYFQKQIREQHTYITQPQMEKKKRFGFI